jgi:hydroxymethylpyrimidine pyrophosphatase-like HAD family hydrolase
MDDNQTQLSDETKDAAKHAYQRGFRKAIETGAKQLRDETEDYKVLAEKLPPEYAHQLGEIFRMGFRTGQYKLLSGNSEILEIMQKNVEKKDW